jgi:hypothetical protein
MEFVDNLADESHAEWRNFAEIHAALEWLWPALAEAMLDKNLAHRFFPNPGKIPRRPATTCHNLRYVNR